MCIKASFIIIAAISLTAAPQTLAQNKNDAVLTKQFRQGFERGCNTGKTPGVKNQRKYCTCLANSYQARYTGTELTTIIQLAGQVGEKGSTLVNFMMTPETKACNAKH